MGSRLSRQSSLDNENFSKKRRKLLDGTGESDRGSRGGGDFLFALMLKSDKLPGMLRRTNHSPYMRRVAWIKEIQKLLRDRRIEQATDVLKLLRKVRRDCTQPGLSAGKSDLFTYSTCTAAFSLLWCSSCSHTSSQHPKATDGEQAGDALWCVLHVQKKSCSATGVLTPSCWLCSATLNLASDLWPPPPHPPLRWLCLPASATSSRSILFSQKVGHWQSIVPVTHCSSGRHSRVTHHMQRPLSLWRWHLIWKDDLHSKWGSGRAARCVSLHYPKFHCLWMGSGRGFHEKRHTQTEPHPRSTILSASVLVSSTVARASPLLRLF